MLGGDVMLGRGVNQEIQRFGPQYPFEPIRSLTRPADLFMVNLESAIARRDLIYSGPPKVFYFRADPLAVEALNYMGVDAVSLANNHALDADYEGLADTLEILGEHSIPHAGAGTDIEAACRPAELMVRGRTIGLIACCDHQRDFAATSNRAGIYYVDLHDRAAREALSRRVSELATRVDHVVVAFHWQPNWAIRVEPLYRGVAHELVHAGARIVWGHSPHHFQGVEFLGRSVALYSTGDLLTDYAVDPEMRNDRQLLFEVELDAGGFKSVAAHPLELTLGRTVPAGPEAKKWIGERFASMCAELGSRVACVDGWLNVRNPEVAGSSSASVPFN